jgi:hypothetical protein
VSDQINPTLHPSIKEIEEGKRSGLKLTRSSAKYNLPKSDVSRDLGSSIKGNLNALRRSMEQRQSTPRARRNDSDIRRKKF